MKKKSVDSERNLKRLFCGGHGVGPEHKATAKVLYCLTT